MGSVVLLLRDLASLEQHEVGGRDRVEEPSFEGVGPGQESVEEHHRLPSLAGLLFASQN